MRLATIKLAGFKSFVDPTVLHLPTNLTGVVGPNGCGKSNIIDAIRWVMGESAASRLRGDAMTDVIFNGSSERKPVSQASVELIFDNSDQSIVGEFAAYTEISVRRLVTREAQSTYFLNNQRCRRRDITDLFLGTGLGARSYSIIEQGMISQIVESAPEDLRVHLEEAAGISKYKDRRKETESRMKATRENLDRLNDVREEVDKQLEHLERQARQAERYTELKAEQRRKDGELKSLQWRGLEVQRGAHLTRLAGIEQQLLELATAGTDLLKRGEQLKLEHHDFGEQFNAAQSANFAVSAEIARLEQELRFRREGAARLREETAQNSAQVEHLRQQAEFDREQLETLSELLLEGEPRLEALKDLAESTSEELQREESTLAEAVQRTQQQAAEAAQAGKAAEVARTRIELLERATADALKRRDGLQSEAGQIDLGLAESTLVEWENKRETAQLEFSHAEDLLEDRRIQLEAAAESLQAAQAQSRTLESDIGRKRARLGALEALQHAALGQERKSLNEWLRQHALGEVRRLGEVLSVDEGWEHAVEVALDALLEALVVADPAELLRLDAPPTGLAALAQGLPRRGPAGTLAGVVQGPPALVEFLGGVRLAADLAQATAALDQLEPGQSWITPAGEWLGRGWSRVVGLGTAHDGVLLRAREIETLQTQIDAQEDALVAARVQAQALVQVGEQLKRQRDEAQQLAYGANRKVAELSGQVQAQRGRRDAQRGRCEQIQRELQQIDADLDARQMQVRETRSVQAEAVARMDALEQQRQALESERRLLSERLERLRGRAREAQAQAHQLELKVEQQRTARRSLESALQRIDEQLRASVQRAEQLAKASSDNQAPVAGLESQLQLALDQKSLKEADLVGARRALDACTQALQRADAERARIEQAEARLREARGAEQLALQGLEIRAEQLVEQISALECDREALLAELGETQDLEARQRELIEIEARIRRLEPVNLAAIKELEESRTRKTYLDTQLADLNEALATLEEAIRKIDRETRTRFKDTFDQVSEGMKELFPKLFGGGYAQLELTGEDLLTTGVNIIARPPGKRPASIGLLSGGEKALTAVALVFAIFRLNPAPFCLLDEVDAPLDEANVGRFCNMVREMSENVQFLFVTHNKVTMELAHQLAGVTMREPGTSRLVTVDLAEASKLVA